jgi:hypothetical protein
MIGVQYFGSSYARYSTVMPESVCSLVFLLVAYGVLGTGILVCAGGQVILVRVVLRK